MSAILDCLRKFSTVGFFSTSIDNLKLDSTKEGLEKEKKEEERGPIITIMKQWRDYPWSSRIKVLGHLRSNTKIKKCKRKFGNNQNLTFVGRKI